MGEWEVWQIGSNGPLPYDCAVRFNSIMAPHMRGKENYLSLGGIVCMFTEEDAKTIADIMNKQQEAATQYCVDLVRKKNEL